ncbi:MAG TPA: hypothetical protein EYP81_00840 [Thermodesulfobacteriaceae bacterium]|nr:hypothetical protein [Thermodesulfobacteriaceae bacterium]
MRKSLSLQSLISLGLGVLLFLQLFSVGMVWYLFRNQGELAILINLSGRQRMLTQRMTKEILEYKRTPSLENRKRIRATLKLYDESLHKLKAASSLEKEPSVQEALRKNFAFWKIFKKEVEILLTLPPGDAEFERHLEYVLNNNLKLLEISNSVVKAIEKVSLRTQKRTEISLWVISGIFLIILLVLFLSLRRLVIRPLAAITEVFRHIGAGDMRVDFPESRLKEVKILSETAMGLGNFISRTLQALKIQNEVQKVSEDTVRKSADRLRSESEKLNRFSEDIAQAVITTRESVEAVTRSAEELTQAINEISESVTRTAAATGEARTKAEATDAVVKRLGEQAREIGSIVETIQTIAEQTNLLALNATIEAARAGEAGKGFAVVANEVKELARQTAEATKRITETIQRIQQGVEEAVASTDEITRTVIELNEHTNTIASAVEEQTAVVSEISSNLGQVSQEVESLSQKSENLTRISEDFNQMAQELHVTLRGIKESTEELARINQLFAIRETQLEVKGVACALVIQEAILGHIMWKCRVIEAVLTGSSPQVERDPTRCYLGQVLSVWEPKDPTLASLVEKVKEPHRRLHEKLNELDRFIDSSIEEKLKWLEENLYPISEEVMSILFEIVTICRQKYVQCEIEVI